MRRSPSDPLHYLNRGFARTVTIFPPNCDVHIDDLDTFTPDQVLKPLLAALYRYGAGSACGWLIGVIHAEYEPITEMVRFHVHAAVRGGMVGVVDKGLRSAPSYSPILRQVGTITKRIPRIRMSRGPLTDLPYPLTYLLKSYWPSRWEDEIDGQAKRQRRPGRIQGPAHTRCLQWLDRYSLKDLTLLVGVYVSRDGFQPTRRSGVNETEAPIG